MVMMTGLAMTRERERGTMENLLATPVHPLEVMTGKIVPYIFIGLIQATIILLASRFLFGVPVVGSLVTLYRRDPGLRGREPHGRDHAVVDSRPTSCRRCSSRSSTSCPACCCRASCSPSAACRRGHRPSGSFVPMTYFNRLVRGILLKGNTISGPVAGPVAAAGFHRRRDDDRGAHLSQDTGLTIMRRTFHAAVVLSLAGAIGGCTVGPDFHPPEPPTVTNYPSAPVPDETASGDGPGAEAQRFSWGAISPPNGGRCSSRRHWTRSCVRH